MSQLTMVKAKYLFLFAFIGSMSSPAGAAAPACDLNLQKLFADWSCNSDLQRAGCLTMGTSAVGAGASLYTSYRVGRDADRAIAARQTARAKLVQEYDRAMLGVQKSANEFSQLARTTPHAMRDIASKYEFESELGDDLDFNKSTNVQLKKILEKDGEFLSLQSVEKTLAVDRQKLNSLRATKEQATHPKVSKAMDLEAAKLLEKIQQYEERQKNLKASILNRAKKRMADFKELDEKDFFIKLDKAKSGIYLHREAAQKAQAALNKMDQITPRYLRWLDHKSSVGAKNALRWAALGGVGALMVHEVAFYLAGQQVAEMFQCTDVKVSHPYICRAENTCWENFTCEKVQNFMSLTYERQQELLDQDPEMCKYYQKLAQEVRHPAKSVSYSCADNRLRVEYGGSKGEPAYVRYVEIPPKGKNNVTVFDEKLNKQDVFEFDHKNKLSRVVSYFESHEVPTGPELFLAAPPMGEQSGKAFKLRDFYVVKTLVPLAQQCCAANEPDRKAACADIDEIAGTKFAPKTKSQGALSGKKVR